MPNVCCGAIIIPYFVIIYIWNALHFDIETRRLIWHPVYFLLCKCSKTYHEKRVTRFVCCFFHSFSGQLTYLNIFLLLIASILLLLLSFFFSFFDNISYLPRHTNNAHFMLNSRRLFSLFAFEFPFLWCCCSFSFYSLFFFLFIFTFGKNNNEQQSNRIHRNVIWYYFPFYSLYHFLCERYRMQSVTSNTSWLSLSLFLSAIYLHAFIFMSFVSFILCHSSVFMFASLFVNTPPPPTMVTNFGWVSSSFSTKTLHI